MIRTDAKILTYRVSMVEREQNYILRHLGFSLRENICTVRLDFYLKKMKLDYWLGRLSTMCAYLKKEWEETGAEKHRGFIKTSV